MNRKDIAIIVSLLVLTIILLFLGYQDMQRQKELGIIGSAQEIPSEARG